MPPDGSGPPQEALEAATRALHDWNWGDPPPPEALNVAAYRQQTAAAIRAFLAALSSADLRALLEAREGKRAVLLDGEGLRILLASIEAWVPAYGTTPEGRAGQSALDALHAAFRSALAPVVEGENTDG